MADPPAPAHANPDQDQPADSGPADPNVPAPNQPAPTNPVGPAMPVLNQPALAATQIIHQQALNWSHFKPEFAGRPEEDVEAYLPCTNDWMLTHTFLDDIKVQRFCIK